MRSVSETREVSLSTADTVPRVNYFDRCCNPTSPWQGTPYASANREIFGEYSPI
jgi:hypothetical protein